MKEELGKQILKRKVRLYVRPSSTGGYELTLLGKFLYHGRYELMDSLFADPRPYPPVDNLVGSPWFIEYRSDWQKKYPQFECASKWVRDTDGVFVWVTNTPPFDRDWFESRGWRFPARWITGPSKFFYRVGQDKLSEIVSLPKEGALSGKENENR
jgi:hypothetical protein